MGIARPRKDFTDLLLALLVGLTFTGYPAISFMSLPFGITGDQSRILTVPYRMVVLALSLFLFLNAWRRKRLFVGTAMHWLFISLWSIYAFRLTYETVFHAETLLFPVYYYWAFGFGVCFGSNLAFMQPLPERASRLAPWFVWGLALIANLAGLVFRRQEMLLDKRLEVTELLNPISYGQCAVTLILMSGYLALNARKIRNMIFLAACAIPGVFILAITASRSPLLSFLGGMCLLGIYGIKRGAGWKTMLGATVAMGVLPIGIQFLLQGDSAITGRVMDSYADIKFGGQVDRFVLWSRAFEQYQQSPYIGNGLEITGVGYPHNITVETLLTMGLGGCVLFIWLQVCFIAKAKAVLAFDSTAWMSLLALQYMVLTIFSGSFYCSPEFWGLVLLLAGSFGKQLTRPMEHRFG